MNLSAARLEEHRHGRVLELVIANPAQRNALTPEIASGATRAIGRTKRLLGEAPCQDLSQHLERERESFAEGFFGTEGGEGIAASLEKRKASFHK